MNGSGVVTELDPDICGRIGRRADLDDHLSVVRAELVGTGGAAVPE